MMEIWNILDENGNKTGKTMIRGVDKLPDGFYHESVAVWIINSENRLLIQKRASTKKRYPNMWAMTTGAMNANENRNQAIIREIKEELGIDPSAVAVAAPSAAGDAGATEDAAKTVVLKDAGAQKIAVIKVIREITGLGLVEAKAIADNGGNLKENIPADEAEAIKTQLTEAGAEVELV